MRFKNSIISDYNDDEMQLLNEKNKIYYMFELIGIHSEFLKSDEEDFERYYFDRHEKTEFQYRNIGIQTIYELIVADNDGKTPVYYKNRYRISKRSMRRFGVTYKNIPVIVQPGWDKVMEIVKQYISAYALLKNIYIKYIMKIGNETSVYMTFQDVCITRYCEKPNPNSLERVILEMRNNIEDNLKDLNKKVN